MKRRLLSRFIHTAIPRRSIHMDHTPGVNTGYTRFKCSRFYYRLDPRETVKTPRDVRIRVDGVLCFSHPFFARFLRETSPSIYTRARRYIMKLHDPRKRFFEINSYTRCSNTHIISSCITPSTAPHCVVIML